MSPPVASGLAELLGDDRIVKAPAERRRWSVDGTPPGAVAFPRHVDELAEVLAWASREGSTVVPAGRGRWIEGGGPVGPVDLVISTARMRRVREYEPGDLTLTAGAGLPLDELQRRTAEHGQWLPQDPPGWREATLGAFVATGLPGPLVAGFGRPRDQILGLTVVTGDGRIVRPGGRVVKNVAGYDLVRLLVGSWGALGVVASATVRLFPRPERDLTLLFTAPESDELVGLARALATAPVVPDALELRDPAPPAGRVAGEDRRTAGSAGAAVAARLLGSPAAVAEKRRILVEAAGRKPDGVREAPDADRGVPAGDGGAGGSRGAADERAGARLSVRLARLPDRLDTLLRAAGELRDLARDEGRGVEVHGYPTRGVLRVEIGESGEHDGFSDRWQRVLGRMRSRLEEDRGSLTLVRSPSDLARVVKPWGDAGTADRLLRGLKDEFDPAGTLARGRPESWGSP